MDKNFERLLAMLGMMSSTGAISTPEIHRRLTVRGIKASARTVQRDMDALALRFGIERDERTKPYGWRWPKDRAPLSLPEMQWPEALSFRLLEDYLSGLLPGSVTESLKPYFNQARKKLDEHFSTAPIKRWPQKVKLITPGPGLISPKVKRSVHEAVSEALLNEKQISLSYRNVGSTEARTHTVNPLGLVLEGNVLYLVVVFSGHTDPRTLAMHRIEKAVGLPEASVMPAGFNLNQYEDEGGFRCGGDELIKLDATWRAKSGIHLMQAHLSTDQKAVELGDGAVRIKATVRYTERLVWWLMGFGANVEVHHPVSLRREIAEWHREAADQYSEPMARER